jgi:DNA-binding MltR family transcriptional regulator
MATFKAAYKSSKFDIDYLTFNKEVHGSSDRAAIIILAGYLEDGLERALLSKMRKLDEAEKEELFRTDGPIGSLSAKIKLSYALNIIEKNVSDRLHEIRELRNVCAHSMRHISFSDPALANVVKRSLNSLPLPHLTISDGDIRNAFIAQVYMLQNLIVLSKEESSALFKQVLDQVAGGPNT